MNNRTPLLVGITGGIGAGKTTVAKIFRILGIPVYSADDRAKWLMVHDRELKNQIILHFGDAAYRNDGQLDAKHLSEKVFSDTENTKKINGLVHPAVKADFETWAAQQTSPYVLKEAALLFETGSYKELDKVITVSSPLKIRINRVLMRDPHRSEKQINAIIDRQLPDEKKNEIADFVVKNSENKMLIPQVLAIHEKLSSE